MSSHREILFVIILSIMIITAAVTVIIFNTNFAKATIDYFAFFAGIFLVGDALYKIVRRNEKFFPTQLFRFVRLIIGVCVFTIHMMQYIYGV